ncbi:MAG: sensor histidine kinase, partial [Thioploca sp.]|nr:sensor histidine kinase [Thioploca sp.]
SNNVLENIGPFEFIFYFVKNQVSNEERKRFFYRDFNASSRKKWLEHFGGIKLFRDNFRVRPYGETDSRSFDWLLLGERAGRSPQSVGQQRSGSWRVRPNQISGIINISRLANIDFEDTSSRYGLQENKTFDYFTEIIKGILGEFEQDRSNIGRELSAYYSETQLAVSEEKAQVIKREIRRNVSKRRKNEIAKDPVKLLEYTERLEEDSETLVKYTEQLQEQIEVMKNETNLLRILATNALIIASFTHELKNIKNKLVKRIDNLRERFEEVLASTNTQQLLDFSYPFQRLEDIKKDDEKLKQWLHYSLETLRKDKRRRTENDLLRYFREYKESWQMACNARGVKFDLILPQREELKIRVFEADLDSIFNNLLINSFEAFLRRDAPHDRNITIKVETRELDVIFIYKDSGPGLSKDIKDPESIFEPFETTKRDPHSGEEIGTGLGMWLVKLLVLENNGIVELLKMVLVLAYLLNF